MYSKVQFFRTMALLGSLAVTPALADDWPKRGLAANDDVPIYEFGGSWEGDDSQVNWQYNWDSTTTQKQTFAEYVPMLWGTASDHTTDWFDNAWYWLDEGGSGHLLAFNEPEIATQSDIDPTDAAAAYLTYMQPFAGYAQLGSPAVSNDGYDWMSEFLTACSTCEIDFLAVHWYNDYTEFADLQNWITEMCTLGDGRLIWLTEVCCCPLLMTLRTMS